jgi:hypothetical protein
MAITLATSGCHVSNPYKPTDPTPARQAAASLTSLPTLEDTRAQLISTIETVGQQISAVAPGTKFEWRLDEGRVGCNPPYEQSEGQEILLAKYVSDVPIAEQFWKRVYDIVAEAAKTFDAGNVMVFKNAPDNHDVQFSSATGTVLRVASQKAALLAGSTGCRLSADKH